MKILKENDFYKTTDLALCGVLYIYGYNLEALDRQDPQRVVFLIKRESGLDDVVKLALTHELRVDPLAYFNALKEIKTRLYNSE
jgi:hypothetical protein